MTIVSFQAQDIIKAAAKVKDQEMHNEIEDLDLIAKEFKMHDHCRKTFLKEFGDQSREKLESAKSEVPYDIISIILNFYRGYLQAHL